MDDNTTIGTFDMSDEAFEMEGEEAYFSKMILSVL
jgi:hypothetical protein